MTLDNLRGKTSLTLKRKESSYEDMTSNLGTLPRREHSSSEKSLDNILYEARKDIIETDVNEDVYVTASQENIYEELYFCENATILEKKENMYEEIRSPTIINLNIGLISLISVLAIMFSFLFLLLSILF